MKKMIWAVFGVITLGATMIYSQPTEIASQLAPRYLSATDLRAALLRTGRVDIASRGDSSVTVIRAARRGEAGSSEVHERRTHVVHIISGEAVFVVGGTLRGRVELSPHEYRGMGIDGGQTYRLKEGDLLVIPAAAPHWLREVPADTSYLVFNVDDPDQ
jgi:mannose-6-phosphate isomerase-like protein (cupin superfamily)